MNPVPVILLRFASDSQSLIVGNEDLSVVIWDVKQRKVRTNVSVKKPIEQGKEAGQNVLGPDSFGAQAVSPDLKTFAVGTKKGVELWNLVDTALLGVLETAPSQSIQREFLKYNSAIVFNQNAHRMVVAHGSNPIEVWDVPSKRIQCKYSGQEGNVASIALNPDGSVVASRRMLEFVTTREAGGQVVSKKPLPNRIHLWEAQTGKQLAVLSGHQGPIRSLAFSPDGKTLVSASDDQTVRVWDTKTNQSRSVLEDHNGTVDCLAFSSDGKTVASGSFDQTVILWTWKTPSGSELFSGPWLSIMIPESYRKLRASRLFRRMAKHSSTALQRG